MKKYLAIFILIIVSIISYYLYQFYLFVTSGTLDGALWGIGIVVVPIILFVLSLWIRGELYQHKRAKINKQGKERYKREEIEKRKKESDTKEKKEREEKAKKEESNRKYEARVKEAKRKGVCISCGKSSSNLDSLVWCEDCVHIFKQIQRKIKEKEEKPLRDAEKAGKDVCWKCKTIEPPRCGHYYNHCQKCFHGQCCLDALDAVDD